MRTSNLQQSRGFTLLELVVVLAILAIVTGLAVRSLDQVGDQQRYEASRRIMQDIEEAVLGSPNDRAEDGTRISSGFVADMGRLPLTVGDTNPTLAELWSRGTPPNLPAYDVRKAEGNGVLPEHVDTDVWVPGGWRGPDVRLPINAFNILDGWGNPMQLCSASGVPPADVLTTSNQQIEVIRHLGANGTLSPANSDEGVDRDAVIALMHSETPQVKAYVQVLDSDGNPAPITTPEKVIVRVFGPDPADAAKIAVAISDDSSGLFIVNGVTVGPRVVRAYLHPGNDSVSAFVSKAISRSRIKHVTLQPGVNHVHLDIFRPSTSTTPPPPPPVDP